MNQVVGTQIIQGAVDQQVFAAFIEQLLTKMRADQHLNGRQLVVFMDNAMIHRGPLVRRAVARHDALALFNCPYSPDFNPIENYFASLKGLVKRHTMTN